MKQAACLLFAALAVGSPLAASALPVDLGTAGNFTILAKTGISAAPGPPTSIVGDMGISPAAASFIGGFPLVPDPSGQFSTASGVQGKIYAADDESPTPAVMKAAISDMQRAYLDAAGREPDLTDLSGGSLGGLTLVPGVYKWTTALSISRDLTLEGGPTAVWIFQVGGALKLDQAARIVLSGGAQAKNIFWQVSDQAQVGANAVFNGSILGQGDVALLRGASMNGKALAQKAVVLQSNTVLSSPAGYVGPNPPAQGKIFAFPSPVRGSFINVVYDMRSAGRARIQVWDAAGDLASDQEDQKLPGPQRTQLLVEALAPGVYFYRAILAYDDGSSEQLSPQKFSVIK